MDSILIVLIIIAVVLFIIAGIIWLFLNHGVDKLRHPEEWKDTGSSGERILYNTLIKQFKIPENQILRNVYVPTHDDRTAEIDLLVISKKGLFVFECKNYGGNIYGDAKRPKWIQYIGNKKSFFYNPLLQNKNHVKHLNGFLALKKINVPIVPLVSTISRGNWKIENLEENDYVLGLNCHLKDIYGNMPDSDDMAKHFKLIMNTLTPLSRPSESVRREHIRKIR